MRSKPTIATTLVSAALLLVGASAQAAGISGGPVPGAPLPIPDPASRTVKVGAVSAAPGARQRDFTLHIPVHLQRLHRDVRGAKIHCVIGTSVVSSRNAHNIQILGGIVARGETPIALDASGNYRGTAVVHADALPGRDPATATNYLCELQLNNFALPRQPDVPTIWQSSPGTPRSLRVEGVLAR